MPEHVGVDPRVKKLVGEFMWLSAQNNISFRRKVTVGLKDINRGNAVGLCTYGGRFREIDIDTNYWNRSSYTSKMTVLFHELTHCYCGRGHTYGKDLSYPETEIARIARAIQWKIEGGDRPGYWDDGCPSSIMYPIVLDDNCMNAHYNEYVEEMFNNCVAW